MELHFIYNSNQIKEREALGYAKSLPNYEIKETDLYKDQLTERQIAELAKKMDASIADLFDKESELYKDKIEGSSFDNDDALQLLKQHPNLIKTPILEFPEKATFLNSPFSTNNMDMKIKEISSSMANRDEK